MPARQTISPGAVESAIRTARTISPWVPARNIMLRTGGTSWAISKAADDLYAKGTIDRRWIDTQWWYRIKGAAK